MQAERPAKTSMSGNWQTVLILAANLVLHNIQRFAPVSLFEELRAIWNSDYTGMGMLFGAHLMAYAVTLVPVGMLADRVDNKRLMMMGVLLSLASSLFFAISPDLNRAILARLGLGASGALIYVPTVRYLVSTFEKKKRASAMGCLEFGAGLGYTLALATLPGAMGPLGLRGAFLIPPAMAAVLVAVIALKLRSTRSTRRSIDQKRAVLTSWVFWAFFIFNFLGMLAGYAVSGWLPTYLRRDFGYGAVDAGLVAALVSGALMVFSPLAGVVSDRLGARKPVLLAGSALAVGCLAAMVMSRDIRVVIIAAVLVGVSKALTIPVAMIFAGEIFANAGAGLAVALTATTGQIASSLSGPLCGYILDLTRSFIMVWAVALACSVAKIPFLMVVREKKGVEDSRKL